MVGPVGDDCFSQAYRRKPRYGKGLPVIYAIVRDQVNQEGMSKERMQSWHREFRAEYPFASEDDLQKMLIKKMEMEIQVELDRVN